MLWQVQILSLFLIQGQAVLVIKHCTFTIHESNECWITNCEVWKALLPFLSRQCKSSICAWLGTIQSTRISESYRSVEKKGFESLSKLLFLFFLATISCLIHLSQIPKYYTIFTFIWPLHCSMDWQIKSLRKWDKQTLIFSSMYTKTWIPLFIQYTVWGCQGDGYSSLIFCIAPGLWSL